MLSLLTGCPLTNTSFLKTFPKGGPIRFHWPLKLWHMAHCFPYSVLSDRPNDVSVSQSFSCARAGIVRQRNTQTLNTNESLPEVHYSATPFSLMRKNSARSNSCETFAMESLHRRSLDRIMVPFPAPLIQTDGGSVVVSTAVLRPSTSIVGIGYSMTSPLNGSTRSSRSFRQS